MTRERTQWLGTAAVSVGVLALPVIVSNEYYLHLAITILAYSTAALGARLLMLGGLWSFGQGAFLTLGAYVVAIGMTRWNVSFWILLPLAGGAAAVAAGLLGFPALRLRGVQFSILTMVMVFAVREFIVVTPSLTQGAGGIVGVPAPGAWDGFGRAVAFESKQAYYYIFAAIFLTTFVVMRRLDRSRAFLILGAMRQEHTLAESVGINLAKYRVAAFMTACGFAGLAGAASAPYYGTAHPQVWSLWPSIFIIAYAIIGGVGSAFGPLLGASVIIVAVELLRATEAFQVILLGVGLMVVMYALPGGLIDLGRHARRGVQWVRRPTSSDNPVASIADSDEV